jgi:hypothetical protein
VSGNGNLEGGRTAQPVIEDGDCSTMPKTLLEAGVVQHPNDMKPRAAVQCSNRVSEIDRNGATSWIHKRNQGRKMKCAQCHYSDAGGITEVEERSVLTGQLCHRTRPNKVELRLSCDALYTDATFLEY